jgi:SAM-dependent methyltransferase
MTSTCPICFSHQIKQRRNDKKVHDNTFLVCLNCGFGFNSKLPFTESIRAQVDFNQGSFFGLNDADPVPEGFQRTAHYSEPSGAWHLARFQQFSPGRRLLDIGCGMGGFLSYIKAHSSIECHGTDISPKACSMIEKTLAIPTRSGPFNRDLYAGETFDMIFLSHVIEHIPDPHGFVKDVRAICAPGATIGIVCPNDASLTALVKRWFFYPWSFTSEYGHLHWPMHLNGFTPNSLNLLFSSEGFAPLLTTTWSKTQPLYGLSPTGWDRLLYPLYLAEQLLQRGNMLVAYFQAPR